MKNPSRTSRYRRIANPRRGATVVEFAIAAVVLFLMVFASIELVRLELLRHAVDQSSYLAARRGIIAGATTDQIRQVAEDHMAKLGVSNTSVNVTPGTITDDTEIIEVRVLVPTAGNTWISPVYFNGTMTGRTRILTERPAADMVSAIP